MLTALALALLTQTGICKSGAVCQATAFQPPCIPFASFPTCATALKGREMCNSTNNCWEYCNGTSWSCVATAATAPAASYTGTAPIVVTGGGSDGGTISCTSASASAGGCLGFSAGLLVADAGLQLGNNGAASITAAGVITGSQVASTAASGSVGYVMVTGQRHGLITGSGDYYSCDGTTCTYVGTTITAPGFATVAGSSFTSNTEDGVVQKLGSSSSLIGMLSQYANRTTPVGNVGAGEDDLQSVNLVANGLTTTGHCVEYRFNGTFANNANAKTLKIYFGSTAMVSATLPVATAGAWFGEAVVCRTGASAQRYGVEVRVVDTGTALLGSVFTGQGTAAETESAIIVMKATGNATSDNDIIENLCNYWVL